MGLNQTSPTWHHISVQPEATCPNLGQNEGYCFPVLPEHGSDLTDRLMAYVWSCCPSLGLTLKEICRQI